MCYLRVQRLLQVLQDGTSSNDTTLQVIHTKTFQRLYVEVFVQLLVSCLLSKHPVVEFEGEISVAEETFELTFLVAVKEHFLG